MTIKHNIKKLEQGQYPYQKTQRYYAQVSEDMVEHAVTELDRIGAKNMSPEFRGITFSADQKDLYRITYSTRLVSRILAVLSSFTCNHSDMIYAGGSKVEWQDFFSENQTFSVSANVSDSNISHSKYAALRLKDAIVDYFREKTGTRPNVSVYDPDVQFNLHIKKNIAQISIDVSGGPLHKRGYREETVTAPMQETTAAAVIELTQWDGSIPLYDPMCGSGTLICEALMKYCRIPPGIFRHKFGFEFLPDFDAHGWQSIKKEIDYNIIELPHGLIAGSGIDKKAVRASRTNLMGLHSGNQVDVDNVDFNELNDMSNRVIVTNPPYGIRMGKNQSLDRLYKELGDFLKQKCKGSNAYIFFGEREFIKKIGLKPTWKKPMKTGGLDCRLVKYELY